MNESSGNEVLVASCGVIHRAGESNQGAAACFSASAMLSPHALARYSTRNGFRAPQENGPDPVLQVEAKVMNAIRNAQQRSEPAKAPPGMPRVPKFQQANFLACRDI